MAKLGQKEIRTLAKAIIAETPGGIRYGQLIDAIKVKHPETPENTIQGSVWNLASLFPTEIVKPSRGLFKAASQDGEPANPSVTGMEQIKEVKNGKTFDLLPKS